MTQICGWASNSIRDWPWLKTVTFKDMYNQENTNTKFNIMLFSAVWNNSNNNDHNIKRTIFTTAITTTTTTLILVITWFYWWDLLPQNISNVFGDKAKFQNFLQRKDSGTTEKFLFHNFIEALSRNKVFKILSNKFIPILKRVHIQVREVFKNKEDK